MTIDWTLPVETTEDPPRPVRVLATDMKYENPIVCAITEKHGYECVYLYGTDGRAKNAPLLRNVAPPKPEPVLYEAWVVWDYSGERSTTWEYEALARNAAAGIGGVYARAAVMSDGSPVRGEPPLEDMISYTSYERMCDERDHWKAKAEALQAEVERLKPVMDAAVIWVRHFSPLEGERLAGVVRAYHSQQAPASSLEASP